MKNIAFLLILITGISSISSTQTKFKKVKQELFTISVPKYMDEMYDLNTEAELQMGFVEEKNNTIEESYVIVLMETKKEIESYDLEMEFDTQSYWDISVESIRAGLDEYVVDTKEPEIITVNGMSTIISEMHGRLGDVLVSYKLGVYEGEKAFFQVLTWTVTDQMELFEPDMDKMLNSFKEK